MDESSKESFSINKSLDSEQIVALVAEFLEVTGDQALELRRRIKAVTEEENEDGGFGDVWMEFRRRKLFRMSHKIDGKPMFFKGMD